MFGRKVEKAKSDWPVDKVNVNKCYVDILGRYPAPNCEMKAIGFALVLTVVSAPFLIFLAPILGFIAYFSFWSLFQTSLNIRISPEEIKVNGRRYALSDIREFRVEAHERAHRPDAGVYAHALEVVMQYGEKRITIAEMRDKDLEKARALVLRLIHWAEKFEEMISHARQAATQEIAPVRGDFGPSPDIR